MRDITGSGEVVTGASRIDLAVFCPDSSSLAQAHLKYDGKLIAVVAIGAMGSPDPTPFCEGDGTNWWTPLPPHHPSSLQNEMISDENKYNIGMTASQLNGASWNPTNSLLSRSFDTVQEWMLSGTNAHPYHQHLYHMQPQANCGHHKQYEWYDTISASGDCPVRFKLADIGGRCVFHCHVLSHEDSKCRLPLSFIALLKKPRHLIIRSYVLLLLLSTRWFDGLDGCYRWSCSRNA